MILILLLLGLVLFEQPANPVTEVPEETTSAGFIQEHSSETKQQLEILTKDLKTSNFLTPRRNIQPFQQTFSSRIIHQLTKQLRASRLKGEEEFCKILQFNSYRQTIKLSSLLCRRGYHIYALRKIII